jgi:hypothetical protein
VVVATVEGDRLEALWVLMLILGLRRTGRAQKTKDWVAGWGGTNYAEVSDDNPETRGHTHQECARNAPVADTSKTRDEYQAGNPGLGGAIYYRQVLRSFRQAVANH